MYPTVNLSHNSKFQDTYFAVNAQLTPYRQLRQIELEIRSIEDSIKQAEFATRRLAIKMNKLNPEDESDAIDLDEAKWDLGRQEALLNDAFSRLANFKQMREDLLAMVPKHYWDAGFEAAEAEHWTVYYAKQLSTAMALGLPPPPSAMEAVLLLPEINQRQCIALAQTQVQQLQLAYAQQTQTITNQANPSGTEGEPEPEVRSLQAPT